MAKNRHKPDDPKPGLVDLPTVPDALVVQSVTADPPGSPPEVGLATVPGSELAFAPAPVARLVDPLDVAEVHRLRLDGRLYRVKLKHPAAGQALVEADSADAAIAGFVAARPDAKATDCKAEKLKP